MGDNMYKLDYNSPMGTLRILEHDGYIVEISFMDADTRAQFRDDAYYEALQRNLGAHDDSQTTLTIGKRLPGYDKEPGITAKACAKELDGYFAGKLKKFTVPVKLLGTEFRRRVWAALMDIPYGQTISYKTLAENIGQPKAARAVGSANNNNPVSIIVPCHRVVGASGALVGYGGGLGNKEWLLELEGVKGS